MQGRPGKGEGERFLECRYYEDCLDLAALQNWKSWCCEDCDFFNTVFKKIELGEKVAPMSTIPEKPENARICEECNKNKTISPKHSLCASCMARRSNKSRSHKEKKDKLKGKAARPKKSQQGANAALTIEFGKQTTEDKVRTEKIEQAGGTALEKRKGPTQSIGQPEIVDSEGNVELVLKLGKHGYLLKDIERLAQEEIRSTEGQIIYILKNYLTNTQAAGGR